MQAGDLVMFLKEIKHIQEVGTWKGMVIELMKIMKTKGQ
jgi:hypothetical protein